MQIFAPRVVTTALLLLATALNAVDALNVRLHGINYNSRRGPDWQGDFSKRCKSEQVIANDMRKIKEFSDSVRIYSLTDCDQGLPVARAAKAAGLKIALGIWTTADPQHLNDEITKLGALIDAGLVGDNVAGLHVGSEAIYRKDVSAATAIEYLNRVRTFLASRNVHIPLTIADVVDSYTTYPELIDAVDYISINQFSFWERADISEGVPTMLDRIRPLRVIAAEKHKSIVIGETGWSSQGSDESKASVASPANQARFFRDFYAMATAHGFAYYWFVAFDSLWRVQNGEHEIEGYFGVYTDTSNVNDWTIVDPVMKSNFAGLTVAPRSSPKVIRSVGSQLLLTQSDNALRMAGDADASNWLLAEQQTWYYDEATNTLRSKGNDRCLDTYQPFDGGSVRLYACLDNEPNQKWVYESATRRLRHGTYTSLCLDTDVGANNKLQVYGCSPDNTNQQWILAAPGSAGPSPTMTPTSAPTPVPTTDAPAPVSDGSVRFFTKESLSTHYAQLVRLEDGNVGIGYGASGVVNSEWWYHAGGNTRLVQSKDSNLCLDAYERWDGGRVHVWTCNPNEPNQQWSLDESTGQLKHDTHTGFCLDADQSSGKVSLYGCHLANNNQVWRRVSNVAKGVRIHNEVRGDAVLMPTDSDTVIGARATGRDDQQWFWDAAAMRFTSKWRNECLDAYEGWHGGRVHTYACIDGEANQHWRYDAAAVAVTHNKHKGFCLAYNDMNNKVMQLKTCDASDITQRIRVNQT